jgi:hypothetical protein
VISLKKANFVILHFVTNDTIFKLMNYILLMIVILKRLTKNFKKYNNDTIIGIWCSYSQKFLLTAKSYVFYHFPFKISYSLSNSQKELLTVGCQNVSLVTERSVVKNP